MSRRISAAIGMTVLLLAVPCVCNGAAKPAGFQVQPASRPGHFEARFETMGTDARVQVAARDPEHARRMIDRAVAEIRADAQRMSTYLPDSEISRLNRRGGEEFVRLSDHSMTVLRKADEVSRLSNGAFDVTYAPLRTLWQKAQREGREPSQAEIDAALALVGYTKLTFQDGKARLAQPGMEVDLGGIAKGYVIDIAVAALTDAGAEAGFVDIGGDIRFFGSPEPGRKWLAGVRSPTDLPADRQLVLAISEGAVATSGDYARGFRVGEKWFSHIIDPRTGRPVPDMASVTVVAADATAADGLSTAVSVLGPVDGLALIESLPGVECMILAREPGGEARRYMSKGFAELLQES